MWKEGNLEKIEGKKRDKNEGVNTGIWSTAEKFSKVSIVVGDMEIPVHLDKDFFSGNEVRRTEWCRESFGGEEV